MLGEPILVHDMGRFQGASALTEPWQWFCDLTSRIRPGRLCTVARSPEIGHFYRPRAIFARPASLHSSQIPAFIANFDWHFDCIAPGKLPPILHFGDLGPL